MKTWTEKRKQAFAKAESKLPVGWRYDVSNDLEQVNVRDETKEHVGCATLEGGKRLTAWANNDTAIAALNRAGAAIWRKQPLWNPETK